MKKYLVVLTMVLTLTLVAVTPAMAGVDQSRGIRGGGQRNFSLVGTITAIDGDVITVQALNDRFAGQVLTIQTTSNTRFIQWTSIGSVPISFNEISVDDSVNVKGTMTDGTFIASRVTIDVPLYCYP